MMKSKPNFGTFTVPVQQMAFLSGFYFSVAEGLWMEYAAVHS